MSYFMSQTEHLKLFQLLYFCGSVGFDMSTHGVAAAAATKKGTSTARCIGRTQRVSLFSMHELRDQIKTIGTMTSKGAAPF